MDKHIPECEKKTRWYQTCDDIWEKARNLNARQKGEKGLDYTISETIDDLITEKSDEVFSRTQK